MKWYLSLAIGCFLLSNSGKAESAEYSNIIEKIEKILPFEIESVRASNINGMLEVVSDKGIFYVSEDGEHLFHGSIHKFEDDLPNLTQSRNAEILTSVISELEPSFITYPAADEKHEVLVFFDTSCGYCRMLHEEISKYNAAGITIHYAMYPRSGLSDRINPRLPSASKQQMEGIVCADNPKLVMNLAMRGGQISPNTCSTNKIAEHYSLGQRLGVKGTPAIYSMNATQVAGGFARAPQLLATLESGK